MLDVTFLNVGQGDSIILEWENSDHSSGMFIVDCNKTAGGNPVIDYLARKQTKIIDFLLLTHPHFDHYSGMMELLDYCYQQSILIKTFFFTGKNQPDYMVAATKNSLEAKRLLSSIFDRMLELYDIGVITEYYSIEAGPLNKLELNDNLKLEILSPSSKEERNFVKTVMLEALTNTDIRNNPAANWLSSVLKISTDNWYILLTSDSYKETLVRLDSFLEKEPQILKIGQSAHHGSLISHNNTFWKKRHQEEGTRIIFSVGENSYGHPADAVVDFFEDNLFDVYSTNMIGKLNTFGVSQSDSLLQSHIQTFTTLMPSINGRYSGNQRFTIEESGNVIYPIL